MHGVELVIGMRVYGSLIESWPKLERFGRGDLICVRSVHATRSQLWTRTSRFVFDRLNFEDDLFCKALWVYGYESAPDHHSVLEHKAYWLALEPQELLVRNHELPLRRYDDVHITSG